MLNLSEVGCERDIYSITILDNTDFDFILKLLTPSSLHHNKINSNLLKLQ